MCGICGIYNFSQNRGLPADERLLDRMVDKIAHRGPDDSGTFVHGPVGLGNRRLSIIDLSKGHQPIFNEDGTIVIVFNGEVYNFQEVRADLIKRGHIFATETDTEMLIHAYEEYGTECVHHFNGMFAFAIWDGNMKRLFIARDRLGIKPLFYSLQNGSLTFASEIKCILERADFERGIDHHALDAYFSLGYVPAPRTIFDGIEKLLPGHLMVCDGDGARIHRYWDVSFQQKRGGSEADLCDEFIELMKDSIRLQLISDVPVGVFLSGGIDSSLVVALMKEVTDQPPRTFSIGFDDALYDESPYAAQVAAQFHTEHRNFLVKADIHEALDRIVDAFDEPFADDGAIPCFHLCRETGREVKVALSGLGGDELFGGYYRYLGFQLSEFARSLPLSRLSLWKNLIGKIPENRNGGCGVDRAKRFMGALSLDPCDRYVSYLLQMDRERRESFFSKDIRELNGATTVRDELASIYARPAAGREIDRAYYLDLMTYLPEDVLALTDRMSMWNSLEVRVPFLDHRLVEFSASLEPGVKIRNLAMKYFLRNAARRFLPDSIVKKRKQGFVGPLALWLRRDLKDYTMEILSEENLKRHGLFNYQTVQQILSEHMTLRRKHETLIWSMLVFERWFTKYME
jgi:asparagine synthase (glutamine-hydrolysing)